MLPDAGSAAEDGNADSVRTRKDLAPIGGGGDGRPVAALVDQLVTGAAGKIEPLFVDVYQGDLGVAQEIEGEQIAHQVAREPEAARSYEDDFRHGSFPFLCCGPNPTISVRPLAR